MARRPINWTLVRQGLRDIVAGSAKLAAILPGTLVVFLVCTVMASRCSSCAMAEYRSAALCARVSEGDTAAEAVRQFEAHSCQRGVDALDPGIWCVYGENVRPEDQKCWTSCHEAETSIGPDGRLVYTRNGFLFDKHTCEVTITDRRVTRVTRTVWD